MRLSARLERYATSGMTGPAINGMLSYADELWRMCYAHSLEAKKRYSEWYGFRTNPPSTLSIVVRTQTKDEIIREQLNLAEWYRKGIPSAM